LTAAKLAWLRHKQKRERQAEVLRRRLSVHRAAVVLTVAASMAFRWRHRVLQIPQDLKARMLRSVTCCSAVFNRVKTRNRQVLESVVAAGASRCT
jgi:hypothetical protein